MHTGARRTVDMDCISMAVGATNDRLPIDSHRNGRWDTRQVTAATEELEVDSSAGSHDVQERRRQVNKAKQVRQSTQGPE